MQIRKAVITAAAPNQVRIPTQQLVDRNGDDKSALQLILEEILSCGVEETCVVIRPGDRGLFEQAAGGLAGSVRFAEQPQPAGYADAILRAESFVADEPFLHLVGDHLYLSGSIDSCAKQLVRVAGEYGCSVSAVQATRENNLPYFGIVAGTRVPRREGVFEVSRVVEKPTPTHAEQELVTAGLRAGNYLGFFGMHVLTRDIFESLHQVVEDESVDKPTLSDALDAMRLRHKYMAFEVRGRRYNLGIRYGLLIAQLAIGLSGRDRDQILTEMVELLAQRTLVDPPEQQTPVGGEGDAE